MLTRDERPLDQRPYLTTSALTPIPATGRERT
jgi:hypothetical protein